MALEPFFITEATGAQGGHTAGLLLASGFQVHAIARDANSASAIKLHESGAKIFQASFDDVEAMATAASGCTAAFLNASPVFTDTHAERRHVVNMLDACRRAGISQVLYTSTLGIGEFISGLNNPEPRTFMRTYCESKAACERAIQQAGVEKWTVVRVPRLANNCIAPTTKFMFPELAGKGIIRTALKKDSRQNVLDSVDLGKVAKEILTGSYDAGGRVINLTSAESLTIDEIVRAMNQAVGKEVVILYYYTEEEVEAGRAGNPLIQAEDYINKSVRPESAVKLRDIRLEPSSIDVFFAREIARLGEAVGS